MLYTQLFRTIDVALIRVLLAPLAMIPQEPAPWPYNTQHTPSQHPHHLQRPCKPPEHTLLRSSSIPPPRSTHGSSSPHHTPPTLCRPRTHLTTLFWLPRQLYQPPRLHLTEHRPNTTESSQGIPLKKHPAGNRSAQKQLPTIPASRTLPRKPVD